MLARSAYQPANPRAEQKPLAGTTPFQAEPVRKTVKSSPAVQIELSDAARAALLGLQEISPAAASGLKSSNLSEARPPPPQPNLYVPPGANLNLSV